jgi:hypothetical protein
MYQKLWRIGAMSAIACAAAVGVAAQTADPSQSREAKSTAMNTVTVTGCVQRADSMPTGTSGTAGASTSVAPSFILANVTSGSSSATIGTSGVTPSASSATASSYRLDADDSKLNSHVGHRVEISGTLEPASASPAGEPGAASGSAPKLKVDSVKMIASTCSN